MHFRFQILPRNDALFGRKLVDQTIFKSNKIKCTFVCVKKSGIDSHMIWCARGQNTEINKLQKSNQKFAGIIQRSKRTDPQNLHITLAKLDFNLFESTLNQEATKKIVQNLPLGSIKYCKITVNYNNYTLRRTSLSVLELSQIYSLLQKVSWKVVSNLLQKPISQSSKRHASGSNSKYNVTWAMSAQRHKECISITGTIRRKYRLFGLFSGGRGERDR